MQRVLAERVISISELAKNAGAMVREAQDGPIAVLENNRIKAYLVSAELYETMLGRLGDFNLGPVECRKKGPSD